VSIKNSIAREGLVLIGFASVSVLGYIISVSMSANDEILRVLIFAPMFFYPLYLIANFVQWAFKTLTEKKQ